MLNTAVEDGLLRTNPCKVKGAGAEHAEERPVAMPGQVAKLADAVHPKYRAMVLLAAYCSLRFGELAGLRRGHIDLLRRTVTVEETAVELAGGRMVFGPPKTAASRRVVSAARAGPDARTALGRPALPQDPQQAEPSARSLTCNPRLHAGCTPAFGARGNGAFTGAFPQLRGGVRGGTRNFAARPLVLDNGWSELGEAA
jgi:integrase